MASPKKERFYKRPAFRIGLIFSTIIITLCVVAAGFWLTSKSLFSGNDNLIVRRVVVRSGGWWKNHPRDVMRILNVTTGETHLFKSTLPELRSKLEAQPSIESVGISRIIPDTLVIDINERIPQAFLHWKNNSKVVDGNGVVMSTASCVSVGGDLPVVTGFRSKKEDLIPGNRLPQVMPAMDLIEAAARIVPDMRFLRVSLNNPDYFKTEIRVDRSRKNYEFYLSKKGYEVKLHALSNLLARISRSHPKAKTIDMRYKGQAVVK